MIDYVFGGRGDRNSTNLWIIFLGLAGMDLHILYPTLKIDRMCNCVIRSIYYGMNENTQSILPTLT